MRAPVCAERAAEGTRDGVKISAPEVGAPDAESRLKDVGGSIPIIPDATAAFGPPEFTRRGMVNHQPQPAAAWGAKSTYSLKPPRGGDPAAARVADYQTGETRPRNPVT